MVTILEVFTIIGLIIYIGARMVSETKSNDPKTATQRKGGNIFLVIGTVLLILVVLFFYIISGIE